MVGIIESLKKARISAGISQRELAARIGSSQQAIHKIETFKMKPRIDTVCRIAMALGKEIIIYDRKDKR